MVRPLMHIPYICESLLCIVCYTHESGWIKKKEKNLETRAVAVLLYTLLNVVSFVSKKSEKRFIDFFRHPPFRFGICACAHFIMNFVIMFYVVVVVPKWILVSMIEVNKGFFVKNLFYVFFLFFWKKPFLWSH